MRKNPDFEIEKNCGKKIIAGVDEAGRGPLCGPVVAGAVIFLKYEFDNMPLITDSKKMSEHQREIAYDWITNNPDIIWGVGQCSAKEIDEINILQASLLAMTRAVNELKIKPEYCLIDGNKMPKDLIGQSVVKGDATSLSIAAASIIAKQTRDKIMRDLSKQYPQYCWDKNAGYPTQQHLQAIDKYGINEHYRKTYRPVKERILKNGNA
ncbi:MAG: ribonuclease HII [Alphaproteobacteria bacterium]|nr:ribonuclease HII [Alphaproteobacteria bacterium]